MSQNKTATLHHIVICDERPLCLHNDGRMYYNGDITLFPTLQSARDAVSATIEAIKLRRAANPDSPASQLEELLAYEIRPARPCPEVDKHAA